MDSFKRYYRSIYQTLGYPLTIRSGLPSSVLTAAEKRLGVRLPAALREYYLVAGSERRFNACHNRLLPPSKWSIDKHRLVFMEENQAVLCWGVSTRNPGADDPPVSQGIRDESISWHPEHRNCSAFLVFMLHYHAVCGGFRFRGTANPPERVPGFEDQGWTCRGEVGSVSAYGRQNQVVCLMPPGDLPFQNNWTLLVSGKTRADLRAIEKDLGVTVELV